jgi:hypothetical protein
VGILHYSSNSMFPGHSVQPLPIPASIRILEEPIGLPPLFPSIPLNSAGGISTRDWSEFMIKSNEEIWRAGAFSDKCEKAEPICGRKRFSWRGIITVVQRIEDQGGALNIVITAAGQDCRTPTEHDLTHASVSALVVSKQKKFRCYSKRMRVYLEYDHSTIVAVDVDLRDAERQVWQQLLVSEPAGKLRTPLPSILVGFLQRFQKS